MGPRAREQKSKLLVLLQSSNTIIFDEDGKHTLLSPGLKSCSGRYPDKAYDKKIFRREEDLVAHVKAGYEKSSGVYITVNRMFS